MLITSPGYLQMGWLQGQAAVRWLLLIVYHAYCYKLMRDFAAHRNRRSTKWYASSTSCRHCC